jgi:hypothetical protein
MYHATPRWRAIISRNVHDVPNIFNFPNHCAATTTHIDLFRVPGEEPSHNKRLLMLLLQVSRPQAGCRFLVSGKIGKILYSVAKRALIHSSDISSPLQNPPPMLLYIPGLLRSWALNLCWQFTMSRHLRHFLSSPHSSSALLTASSVLIASSALLIVSLVGSFFRVEI